MIEYLEVEDLLIAAQYALPGRRPVLRDPGALAAAAARPRTRLLGRDAYPTLATKAAAVLHSILRIRPLVDGNERLGWLALIGFLRLNGRDLHLTEAAIAATFVDAVATGRLDAAEAAGFIEAHWSTPGSITRPPAGGVPAPAHRSPTRFAI